MKKKQILNYAEAVQYLEDTPRFVRKNNMEDTKAFLARLGNPDRDMKILHIAGTNGKGSVCAYLRSILEEAGYSCCVFTSPHLVEPRERFLMKGSLVSEEDFYLAFCHVYELLDWEAIEQGRGYHPAFFEYLFFMGMLLFKEAAADYCILETGLGGRLDATNAIETKEAAVITRIGLDHTAHLGNSLSEIAGEKAGILSKGRPLVYLDEMEEVSKVFREQAYKLDCPEFSVSKRDYTLLNFKNKTIDFSYHSRYYDYISLRLHTIALYQMENASLAIRTIEALFPEGVICAKQIAQGLEKAFWAGRMEEVAPEVFVDGSHNPDGIRAFLEAVEQDGFAGHRQLVFGVMKDKDYERMVRAIVQGGLFAEVSLVPIQSERAMGTEELQEVFRSAGGKGVKIYPSVEVAYREVKARAENMRIYVAGSLYLVGEVKALIERCGHD